MPIAPVTLITGDEDLLVSRAIAALVKGVRAEDPDADVRDVAAGSLDQSVLIDVATPSLFGEQRVLVVRIDAKLDDDVRDAVIGLVESAGDGFSIVVVHPGGVTGKRVVDACRAAGAAAVSCVGAAGLKGYKQTEFVTKFVETEFASHGQKVPRDAVDLLVASVGTDLRELAAACSQLCSDSAGAVDRVAVESYFRGRAGATGFELADRAVEGDEKGALAELRAVMGSGLDAVLVVSALSRQLRAVARVASAGRGSPDDIGRRLGMHPFAVKKAQKQMRGWTPESLTQAHEVVALADIEVKGGGTDAAYAVERAVRQVAAFGSGR